MKVGAKMMETLRRTTSMQMSIKATTAIETTTVQQSVMTNGSISIFATFAANYFPTFAERKVVDSFQILFVVCLVMHSNAQCFENIVAIY